MYYQTREYAGKGRGVIRAAERTLFTVSNIGELKERRGFLMPPRLLTKFEMQTYHQNKAEFNSVFSRNLNINLNLFFRNFNLA